MTATATPLDRISLKKARRIALAAQGFADRRPAATAPRHLDRLFDAVGLVQIDSVNVLTRSHYLPAFARLGPYATDHLDRRAWGRRRKLFEYWGHEASFLPLDLQPLMRWRMERARAGEGIYKGLARFGAERGDLIRDVLAEVRARGPIGAGDLETGTRSRPGWWEWGEGKTALEWLFWAGEVTTATRRNFERLYDVPERVLPAEVLGVPTPSDDEAQRALMRIAARSLGIATARDLREYFRLPVADAAARVPELVEAGDLVPVEVEGWKQPAFLTPGARVPRSVGAAALLSPFDSLVWERDRAERLFGFRYRIEIYTPAEKRVHGYYVLPFLLGEALVARVCLKADRAAGLLRVNAAHAEEGVMPEAIARPLAEELALMAGWLGLSGVAVEEAGDLSPALKAAMG